MDKLDHMVTWYQQKIGAYDKQLWEKSVEQKVLKSIHQVPKKSARVKPELIDVDLVRGSTFTKAKPQHGWLALSRKGVVRVVFMPLYAGWWAHQTSGWFTIILLNLYCLQVAASVSYVYEARDVDNKQVVSMVHVVTPWIMMVILGLLHAQIVATRPGHKHAQNSANDKRHTCKGRRRKSRSKFKTSSERESGSHETGAESNAENNQHQPQTRPEGSTEPTKYQAKPEGSTEPTKYQAKPEGTTEPTEYQATPEGSTEPTKYKAKPEGSTEPTKYKAKPEGSTEPTKHKAKPEGSTEPTKHKAKPEGSTEPTKYQAKPEGSTEPTKYQAKPEGSTEPTKQPDIKCEDCSQGKYATAETVMKARNADNKIEEELRVTDVKIRLNDGQGMRKVGDVNIPLSDPEMTSQDNNDSSSDINDIQTLECEELLCDMIPDGEVSYLSEESTTNGFVTYLPRDGDDTTTGPAEYFPENEPPPQSSGSIILPKQGQFILSDHLVISEHSPGSATEDTVPSGDARGTNPTVLITDNSCTADTNNCDVATHVHANCVNSHSESPCKNKCLYVRDKNEQEIRQLPEEDRVSKNGGSVDKCLYCSHCRHGNDPAADKVGQVKNKIKPSSLNIHLNGPRKDGTVVSSCESEVDTTPNTPVAQKRVRSLATRRRYLRFNRFTSSQNSESERTLNVESGSTDGQTSEMEWEDTMNSEVTSSDTSSCSTSESDFSDDKDKIHENPFTINSHLQHVSSVMNNLASGSDKVSCMIWEGEEVKKVDLTVLDIGWTIITKVDKIAQTSDYLFVGLTLSLLAMLTPLAFRIYHTRESLSLNMADFSLAVEDLVKASNILLGHHSRVTLIVLNAMVQRFLLSLIFFFLCSVTERTFKQRLLYAKHFCYLTSSRRAKKYELPHFRLNKVRNIKTWLSLRSYLKKRGPQRSVDMIVSAAFVLAVILVSLMSVELLNDSSGYLDHLGNWELMLWWMAIALYLLRFMTLGTKINKKYRNFSVLITEQINLYLHMEQKPHKKDELMLANSVLKLAEDLLKELESPFKISGLSANPFLYNITKVVILSAFSAVLTELLGFKLKLYKIKLRT